jgi:hypothetical protein
MNKYWRKVFLFVFKGSIPFWVLLLGYLYFDPFKVIHHYKNYSYPYVIPNRDFVSTEMYINNQEKYQYNSFIFGSSRALAFNPTIWKNYLEEADKPFMFDASGESLYGIHAKLKYLDSQGANLKNILLILCRDGAFDYSVNPTGHLNIKHPLISKESKLFFHLTFFKSYLNIKFLISFYSYSFSKKFKPYMTGLIEYRKIELDSITNGLIILDQEEEIKTHQDEYYKRRATLFYKRKGEQVDSIQRITKEYFIMLDEIKQILDKHDSNYKVVLSPIYDQVKISEADFKILYDLFGENLYDFTGQNSITEYDTNWYETYHFRPFIADSIMRRIYAP